MNNFTKSCGMQLTTTTMTKSEKRILDAENLSDVNREVIDKLKRVRKQTGLTQNDFAATIEVGQPYINGYEQGRYTPSFKVLKKIAQVYRVDLNWLFGLKD